MENEQVQQRATELAAYRQRRIDEHIAAGIGLALEVIGGVTEEEIETSIALARGEYLFRAQLAEQHRQPPVYVSASGPAYAQPPAKPAPQVPTAQIGFTVQSGGPTAKDFPQVPSSRGMFSTLHEMDMLQELQVANVKQASQDFRLGRDPKAWDRDAALAAIGAQSAPANFSQRVHRETSIEAVRSGAWGEQREDIMAQLRAKAPQLDGQSLGHSPRRAPAQRQSSLHQPRGLSTNGKARDLMSAALRAKRGLQK